MPPKPLKYILGTDGVGVRDGDFVKNVKMGWGGPNEKVLPGPYSIEVSEVPDGQEPTDRYVIRDIDGNVVDYGTGEATWDEAVRLPDGRYQRVGPFELAVPKRSRKKVVSALKSHAKSSVANKLRGNDMTASHRLALASNSQFISTQTLVNSVVQAIEESLVRR